MSVESNYIDTSALAIISELTRTEMRCLLTRRRRMKELDRESESKIFATLQSDITDGQLLCPPLKDGSFEVAIQLIDRLPKISLRTLDALHLAIAQQLNVDCIATVDCVFASAAKNLGFKVIKVTRNK